MRWYPSILQELLAWARAEPEDFHAQLTPEG